MRDDMPVLYSNLGYAYFSQGKYDDSIVAFRTALAKDPQYPSSAALPATARFAGSIRGRTVVASISCWLSLSRKPAIPNAPSSTFASPKRKATRKLTK